MKKEISIRVRLLLIFSGILLLIFACEKNKEIEYIDKDGDGYYAYFAPGPDCDDNDPYNWYSCSTCEDYDGDGYRGKGCDIPEDCDDTDPLRNRLCVEYLDSKLWNNGEKIEVVDRYAYIAYPAGIKIYDVSNPAQPKEISRIYIGKKPVGKPKYWQGYLYIPTRESIECIDVHDPTNPKLLELELPFQAIDISNGLAYVARPHYFSSYPSDYFLVKVFDLSEPESPKELGSLKIDEQSLIFLPIKLCVHKLWLFLQVSNGIKIIDVSDPSNPQLISSYTFSSDTMQNPYFITATDKYIFAVASELFSNKRLKIIDISDIYNPTLAGEIYPAKVVQLGENDKIYYAFDVNFKQLDISDLNSPKVLKFYAGENEIKDFVVKNGLVYLLDGNSKFKIIDLNDLAGTPSVSKLDLSGNFLGVKVWSDYAYLLSKNEGIKIVDISDPMNLQLAGIYLPDSPVYSMDIASGRLYLAEQLKLEIADLSDPAHPSLMSKLDTDIYEPRKIRAVDDYVYIVSSKLGWAFAVVDASDPYNPEVIYSSTETFYNFDVAMPYGYFATVDGLHIKDLSTPSSPVTVFHYHFFLGYPTLIISPDEGRVYIGDISWLLSELSLPSLKVIDISDPYAPEVESVSKIPLYEDMGLKNGIIHFASGENGLLVYKPSSSKFSYAGRYSSYGKATGVDFKNNFAFLSTEQGIEVVDLNQPVKNPLIGGVKSIDRVNDISIVQDKFYVAGGASGLLIYQFESPTKLKLLHKIPSIGDVERILIKNKLALIKEVIFGDDIQQIKIFDIQNSSQPVLLSAIENDKEIKDFYFDGKYLYLGEFGALKIYDLNNPSHPNLLSTIDINLPKTFFAVVADGKYIYISTHDSQNHSSSCVFIYEITDPKNPVLISELEFPRGCDLAIRENYLYACCSGFFIVDVQNPSSPQIVASLDNINVSKIHLTTTNYAFLLGKKGVYLVDISDQSNLEIVDHFTVGSYLSRILWKDGYVYASGKDLLYIFKAYSNLIY